MKITHLFFYIGPQLSKVLHNHTKITLLNKANTKTF